jgi:hypothetical protein
MDCRGELRIDPRALEADSAEIEVVVAHTDWDTTVAVLKRAVDLLAGLNAKVTLLAVHSVPYPASLSSAAASHGHLVAQLVDLASQCPLGTVTPQAVLTRQWEEGFRSALKAESTVLIGSKRHLWRTSEEHLAHTLAKDGHKVALLHV